VLLLLPQYSLRLYKVSTILRSHVHAILQEVVGSQGLIPLANDERLRSGATPKTINFQADCNQAEGWHRQESPHPRPK
jgi:hypothetical protein